MNVERCSLTFWIKEEKKLFGFFAQTPKTCLTFIIRSFQSSISIGNSIIRIKSEKMWVSTTVTGYASSQNNTPNETMQFINVLNAFHCRSQKKREWLRRGREAENWNWINFSSCFEWLVRLIKFIFELFFSFFSLKLKPDKKIRCARHNVQATKFRSYFVNWSEQWINWMPATKRALNLKPMKPNSNTQHTFCHLNDGDDDERMSFNKTHPP